MAKDIDKNCPVCNHELKNAEKVKFPFGRLPDEGSKKTITEGDSTESA